MKRFLVLSLLAAAALSDAQLSNLGHSGDVYNYATSQTSGHGRNGNDLNAEKDTTLNDDTGLFTTTFSNPNVHATIANYVATGRSSNTLSSNLTTYAVHLQASLSADVTLDSLGMVGIRSSSEDDLTFDLATPQTLTIGWSAATESDLIIYGQTTTPVLVADLTTAGSKTLVLPAGSYQILGDVNEYENVSGLYGYTGGHFSGSSSLDYHFGVAPVPEPASFATLGFAGLALVRRRRL